VYDGPTLGWGILRHGAKHLPAPDDPSRPFVLTDEQVDIVLRWYALDERTGEFLYRRGELEMAKGWGKSPFAAFLAIEEFAGPVVFDHWDDVPGGAVGRPWVNPWIQIAAVSEDQTDNTYNALYEILSADDQRAAKSLGIDLGRTRLYLKGRSGVLEPVTAASGSREGQRLTFAVLDETHLWTRRNGGVKLAGTLRRNAAKMGGRTLETTNAPLLGEKSVAEQSGSAPGVFHYARRPAKEPDPNWSDEQMLAALREAYGDAHWVDLPRLVREIRDPATSWDDAVRFYFNIRSAGQGRAVDPRVWDALAKPRDIPQGTRVGLGFDGSVSRDATVLRACTADGYSFIVKSWVRPQGSADWRVNRTDVAEEVARAFGYYDVGLMFVDPFYWRTEMEQWAESFARTDRNGKRIERVLELDTNQARRFAPCVDRWLTGIRTGDHTHDADQLTDLHVKAAHLRKVRLADEEDDGRTRYVLIKGDDLGRIDAAVADVLAYEAAMTMPEPDPVVAARFIPFD
jgi:hypothetical protein